MAELDDRARAHARRDPPLRRGARRDARRRPAPARGRRDGGRGDRRDREASSSASAARSSRSGRSPTRGETLRAAAHRRPPELRHAHPLRPRVHASSSAGRPRRWSAHAAIALENARLHRIVRAPGARRHAHRPRQPSPLRGGARRRADARRALRRLGRASCSPTWTASSRSTTASATRSATACSSSSPRRCASACARSTSPPAGAARSSRSSCPGTDLDGAARLAERARRAFEARTILAPDGTRIHVTVSLGVAAFPRGGRRRRPRGGRRRRALRGQAHRQEPRRDGPAARSPGLEAALSAAGVRIRRLPHDLPREEFCRWRRLRCLRKSSRTISN